MRLAEFIRNNTERILRDWEEFAKTLRGEAGVPRWVLRAHGAAILQSLADEIERQPPIGRAMARSEALVAPIEYVAAAHVDLRIESGFDLAQIIAEYTALRSLHLSPMADNR